MTFRLSLENTGLLVNILIAGALNVSALALLVGWQEWHLSIEKYCYCTAVFLVYHDSTVEGWKHAFSMSGTLLFFVIW